MYNPSRHALAFSSGGAERIRIHGDGNVGVGHFDLDLPSEALDVRGNLRVSEQTLLRDGDFPETPSYSWTNSRAAGMFSPFPDTVAVATAGQERLRVTAGGSVGVGTKDPSDRLSVQGDVFVSGEYKTQSDGRRKKDVREIGSPLEKVGRLRGCTYELITADDTDDQKSKRSMGVIAQEVREVIPEVVHHDAARDVFSVKYDGMVALLIEAMKEMRRDFEERLARLEQ